MERALRQFEGFWLRLESWLAIGGALLLYAMVLLIVCEITLRKLANFCIPGVIELSEFLMVVLVYLAMSYAQGAKVNIRMDFLITHLASRPRLVLELVTWVLGAFLFTLVMWQGYKHFWHDFTLGMKTFGRPEYLLWPHKLFIPLGSFILVVRFVIDIVRTAVELRRV